MKLGLRWCKSLNDLFVSVILRTEKGKHLVSLWTSSEFFSSFKSYGFSCCSSLLSFGDRYIGVCLSSILRREVLHSGADRKSFICSGHTYFLWLYCSQLPDADTVSALMFLFSPCLRLLRLLIVSEWNGGLSVPYLLLTVDCGKPVALFYECRDRVNAILYPLLPVNYIVECVNHNHLSWCTYLHVFSPKKYKLPSEVY